MGGGAWTVLFWPTIRTGCGLFECGNDHKMLENSWHAEALLVCQEEICSAELVSYKFSKIPPLALPCHRSVTIAEKNGQRTEANSAPLSFRLFHRLRPKNLSICTIINCTFLFYFFIFILCNWLVLISAGTPSTPNLILIEHDITLAFSNLLKGLMIHISWKKT